MTDIADMRHTQYKILAEIYFFLKPTKGWEVTKKANQITGRRMIPVVEKEANEQNVKSAAGRILGVLLSSNSVDRQIKKTKLASGGST